MVEKPARDYQSEIDVAVERLAAGHLAREFPDHAIAGEEAASDRVGRPGGGRFIIDPIDGTTNFIWGIPHFAVIIALVEGEEMVADVVHDPMLDETFAAESGRDATLNGSPLRIDAARDMVNAVFGAGLPVPGQVSSVPVEDYHRALRRLIDNAAGVRRLGSAALSIAWVAAGRLDGFFEDRLSLHDYGASALVLHKAGGIATDFAGRPLLDPPSGGPVDGPVAVLVARPGLHGWLLQGFAPRQAVHSPSGSSAVT
ncbi:inositol monophosphatase family protein [Pseudogemmobacter sonorensis]|uniref:inositol monophosphatase family protein n=1 Tax=Pseudogemmobacter sonorensis TaxID=2989681 RepID=UPI0036A47746